MPGRARSRHQHGHLAARARPCESAVAQVSPTAPAHARDLDAHLMLAPRTGRAATPKAELAQPLLGFPPDAPVSPGPVVRFFSFFTGTATTETYTLSLHDALPI